MTTWRLAGGSPPRQGGGSASSGPAPISARPLRVHLERRRATGREGVRVGSAGEGDGSRRAVPLSGDPQGDRVATVAARHLSGQEATLILDATGSTPYSQRNISRAFAAA